MKNFYSIFITAICLVSCSKIEPGIISTVSPKVDFIVANYKLATKANAPTEFVGEFKTTAYYTGEKDWNDVDLSEDAAIFMDDVTISKQEEDGEYVWKANEDYYWPKIGKLSFISYAPVNAGYTLTSDKSAMLTLSNYTIPTPAVDLLVANTAANLTQNTDPAVYNYVGVPVLFRHILSKVEFNAKSKREKEHDLAFKITLLEVKLTEIGDHGNFSWNAVTNTPSWNVIGDRNDMTAYLSNDGLVLTQDYQNIMTETFVIPQVFLDNDTSVIYIKYKVETYKGNISSGKLLDSNVLIGTIKLKSTERIEWKSGTKYVYDIVIDPLTPDLIEFDPVVTPWAITTYEVEI